MSNKKVTSVYIGELHSFFEGLAFIWVFLFGCANLCIMALAKYLAPLMGMPENSMLFVAALALGIGILYLIIAAFSKIRSFAVECALAAWVFYIIAIFEFGHAFSSSGMAEVGVIGATGFVSLIIVLVIALRKGKYTNEGLVTHTLHYKLYRFLRGTAFVIFIIKGIELFNVAVVLPHFKRVIYYSSPLVGGIEGLVLILLGFFSSIFSLGIELIVIGWAIILAYVVFFLSFDIYPQMIWGYIYFSDIMGFAFLILLYLLVRVYIKRYNAQEIARPE